ncbi:MAG: hypothetical protein ACOCP8_10470 [archaeon]
MMKKRVIVILLILLFLVNVQTLGSSVNNLKDKRVTNMKINETIEFSIKTSLWETKTEKLMIKYVGKILNENPTYIFVYNSHGDIYEFHINPSDKNSNDIVFEEFFSQPILKIYNIEPKDTGSINVTFDIILDVK